MTAKLASSSAMSPLSATLVLLAAGPLTIWSLVMLLLLIARVVSFELTGAYVYLGLVMMSFLGALACRRSINVLRQRRGGSDWNSRAGRALMLAGVVVLAHVPVTMFSSQSIGDMLPTSLKLALAGGLVAALVGAWVSYRHQPAAGNAEPPPQQAA